MRVTAVLGFVLLANLALASSVAGQEPGAVSEPGRDDLMVIEVLSFYDAEIADPIQRESSSIFSYTFGELTVYADGVPCGTVRFSPNDGKNLPPQAVVATVVLGLPTQPEECQRDDALVQFVNGFPSELVATTTLQRGATYRMTNLAPVAIDTGRPGLPARAACHARDQRALPPTVVSAAPPWRS